MNCNNLKDGFCSVYQKKNPPKQVCEVCKYRVKKIFCSCYKTNEYGWCCRYNAGGGYYDFRPSTKCSVCDWKYKKPLVEAVKNGKVIV